MASWRDATGLVAAVLLLLPASMAAQMLFQGMTFSRVKGIPAPDPTFVNLSYCYGEAPLAQQLGFFYPTLLNSTSNLRRATAAAAATVWGSVPLNVMHSVAQAVPDPTTSANMLFRSPSVPSIVDPAAELPDIDTLHYVALIDLVAGPVILSVPANPAARFWSLRVSDFFLNTTRTAGTRSTSGDKAEMFLLVGPRQAGKNPPAGFKGPKSNILTFTSDFNVLNLHVFVGGVPDLRAAQNLLDAFALVPPTRKPNAEHRNMLTKLKTAFTQLLGQPCFFCESPPVASPLLNTIAAVVAAAPVPKDDLLLLEAWAQEGLDLRQPSGPGVLNGSSDHALGTYLGAACVRKSILFALTTPSFIKGWHQLQAHPGLGVMVTRAATARALALQRTVQNPLYSEGHRADLFFVREVNGSMMKSPWSYSFNVTASSSDVLSWTLSLYNSWSGALQRSNTSAAVIYSHARGLLSGGGGSPVWVSNKPPPANMTTNWLHAPQPGTYLLVLKVFRAVQDPPSGGRRRLQQSLSGLAATQPTSSCPEGDCGVTVGSGYNVFSGCPVTSCAVATDPGLTDFPIFNLVSGVDYLITPESQESGCVNTDSQSLYYSSADAQSSVTKSMGISLGFSQFSFSSQHSWTSQWASSSTDSLMTQNSYQQCTVAGATLNEAPISMSLTTSFLSQMDQLVSSFNTFYAPGSPSSFTGYASSFISTVGTHYVQEATFGGVQNYQESASMAAYSYMNSYGSSWNTSAGYSADSANIGKQSSSSNSEDDLSYSYTSTYSVSPGTVIPPSEDDGQINFQTWFSGLSSLATLNPVSLDNLVPIMDLLASDMASLYDVSTAQGAPANYNAAAVVAAIGQSIDNATSLYNVMNSLLDACQLGGCTGNAYAACPVGAFTSDVGVYPPNCQTCFAMETTSPPTPGCSIQNSISCSSSSQSSCVCQDWGTGAGCSAYEFGSCSQSYSLFNCHLSWNNCIGPGGSSAQGTTDKYESGSGCYCQCINTFGASGCNANAGGWCD